MKIDSTITLSIIVAIIALITPLFTTIINNRHQVKIKEIEVKQLEVERFYLHKRAIFENAISCISACIGNSSNNNTDSILLACSYTDDSKSVDAIFSVYNKIRTRNYCEDASLKFAVDALKLELVKLDLQRK
ncbi:MAG: hypothetical protein VB122_06730 [Erysipelotrichales bacterium]|nr:hypothetical protein [Erysipelotrichales bacterium]